MRIRLVRQMACCMVLAACLAALLLPCPARAGSAFDSGGSDLDLRRLDAAGLAAYHGRYSEAIDIVTQVIAGSPHFAGAYDHRANYYLQAGRYSEAMADLDRVAAMHPDAQLIYVSRAEIAIRERDGTRAMAELAHAASLPTLSLWKQSYEAGAGDSGGGEGIRQVVTQGRAARMYVDRSLALELQGHDNESLDALQAALALQSEHPWRVYGEHCYTAAVAGLLEMAELTCGQAVDKQMHDDGTFDSMGFVHLKMKAWDRAIADYDRALAARPDLTLSLYGRGLARRARGDVAAGNVDIAAATRDEPDIANIMSRLGVPPPSAAQAARTVSR